jgi:Ca-activated chloride channel family protein
VSFREGWVWWLAVPLLIAMAIWHLLRPRATRQIVPSLQLWQQLIHEQTSTRPWHPPTPWWLVLLRILIVALLAGAAADPTVAALSTPLQRIIIIDTSASMQTIEPAGSRIAQARQIATQIVATSPPATTFSLLTTDHDVTLRANQLSDRNYLTTLIDAVQAQTVAGDISMLPAWVTAMRGRTSEVFLLSDDLLLRSAVWPADWRLIAIGGPVANQSIQGCTFTAGPTGWDGVIRIEADGTPFATARTIELVDENNRLYDATTVTPRADAPVEWRVQLTDPPTLLHARLTPDSRDALASDDNCWWQKTTPTPLRVVVYPPADRFLAAALQILPNVVVTNQVTAADVVIHTDATTPLTVTVPLWQLAAPSTTPPVRLPLLQPEVLHGAEATLDYDIALASSQVLTATVVNPPAWAQTWLKSSAGVHAYAGRNNGVATVVFGFALTNSDLPLRPDFPLLVRNILTYLAPPRLQPSYQTGEAVVVALPPVPLPILAQQPANGQARIVTRATDVVLVDVTQVGAYRINDTWVVANLLAPAESRVDRLASAAPVIATPWLLPAGIALGQWLLVLGILGLCGERWLTWHVRRVT